MESKYKSLLDNTSSEFISLCGDCFVANKDDFKKIKTKEDFVKFFSDNLGLKPAPSTNGLKSDKPLALGTKNRTSKKNPQQFLSLPNFLEYIDDKNNPNICAYMAKIGEHKNTVCARILTEEEFEKCENQDDFQTYRCAGCHTAGNPKKGGLKEAMAEYSSPTTGNKKVTGGNVTKKEVKKEIIKKKLEEDEDDDEEEVILDEELNLKIYECGKYAVSRDDRYPGLILEEDAKLNLTCIGKVVDSMGVSRDLSSKKLTPKDITEDFLAALSQNFTQEEKNFFDAEKIKYSSKKDNKKTNSKPVVNKKPVVKEESDSESEEEIILSDDE